MDQAQRGTSTTIHATFLDGADVVTVASATVAVVDTLNRTVQATTDAIGDDDGGWTFLLPPVAEVDVLTATWTGTKGPDTYVTTTTIEVVGGFSFDIPDLEALPGVVDSGTRYTPEQLLESRQWAEATIESTVRASFVERFQVDDLDRMSLLFGRGYPQLALDNRYPRRLLSISLDGELISDDNLAALEIAAGLVGPRSPLSFAPTLSQTWVLAQVRYVVAYATSWPADLRSASLAAARDHLTSVYGGAQAAGQTALSEDSPTGTVAADGPICRWRDRLRTPAVA